MRNPTTSPVRIVLIPHQTNSLFRSYIEYSWLYLLERNRLTPNRLSVAARMTVDEERRDLSTVTLAGAAFRFDQGVSPRFSCKRRVVGLTGGPSLPTVSPRPTRT